MKTLLTLLSFASICYSSLVFAESIQIQGILNFYSPGEPTDRKTLPETFNIEMEQISNGASGGSTQFSKIIKDDIYEVKVRITNYFEPLPDVTSLTVELFLNKKSVGIASVGSPGNLTKANTNWRKLELQGSKSKDSGKIGYATAVIDYYLK